MEQLDPKVIFEKANLSAYSAGRDEEVGGGSCD
jgi:hypothetical protein